jgi:hypothetical protein
MATVTIRNVPQDVRDMYVKRAQKAGVSLEEYMRRWLEDLAATPTDDEIEDFLARRAEELHARGEWP